jgi:hypothetical protein
MEKGGKLIYARKHLTVRLFLSPTESDDVSCGSFSTEMGCPHDVRFTPVSDRIADIAGGPFRANFGSYWAGSRGSHTLGSLTLPECGASRDRQIHGENDRNLLCGAHVFIDQRGARR